MGTNMLDRLPKVIHLRYRIKEDEYKYHLGYSMHISPQPYNQPLLQSLTHDDQRRDELLSMAYGAHYDIVKDEYITVYEDSTPEIYHHLIAVLSPPVKVKVSRGIDPGIYLDADEG
jgi:hypothetical protein